MNIGLLTAGYFIIVSLIELKEIVVEGMNDKDTVVINILLKKF